MGSQAEFALGKAIKELTAANERIRELEAERDRWYGKATERAIELTAEREVSDKMETALKLADIQYMGCGGNLRSEEVVLAMQRVIQAALSEVSALRSANPAIRSKGEQA